MRYVCDSRGITEGFQRTVYTGDFPFVKEY